MAGSIWYFLQRWRWQKDIELISFLTTTALLYVLCVEVAMHFAAPQASGIGDVSSFAIGATIVTILL